MDKKRVAIIGATGYTGSELVRLLVHHPSVILETITSESHAGERISSVHPFLRGIADHELTSSEELRNTQPDLVFLALPHGVSMKYVKKFSDRDFRIVDLSGDFRLEGPETYESWYRMAHVFPDGFGKAVYGLPELFADSISSSRLVANPGCFPTGAILAAAPLLKEGLVRTDPLIIDSKTGVTGAGNKAKPVNQFSNVHDNFKAYGLKKHRHTIEIQEVLGKIHRKNTSIQFTPHLLPVDRGILTTVYGRPVRETNTRELEELYRNYYSGAPFIRLRDEPPAVKEVRGSNYCDLYATYDDRTGMILVISVIDNLVKGAAGQAVHNMNLMLGFEETSGLELVPLQP